MFESLKDELSKESVLSEKTPDPAPTLRFKMIGVGGAGCNAVNRLKAQLSFPVQWAAIHTDLQKLNSLSVSDKILIGKEMTRGLSAGGDASLGREAAESQLNDIREQIRDQDVIVIIAGLGGGTGSGAAPVVAQAAAATGALVLSFAIMPFKQEGSHRQQQAEDALFQLRETCHATIVLPNEVLMEDVGADETVITAFALGDQWIERAVSGLWILLTREGLMNLDLSTLKHAFPEPGGKTIYALGSGSGVFALEEALKELDRCPLLAQARDESLKKTDSMIINIVGGSDLTMAQVKRITEEVTRRFKSRDETIVGAVIDPERSRSINLTVFGNSNLKVNRRHRAAKSVSANYLKRGSRDIDESIAKTRTAMSHKRLSLRDQGEFDFASESENRGFFEDTDPNEFEGADLDVPTYLRNGLKL